MKRTVFVISVLVILGVLTRYSLKSHSLEMVHIVVVNAVAHKVPDNYPKSKVYNTFSTCLERAERENQDQYLQKLLTLSHQLEKVQYLEEREVDTILRDLGCN